MLTIREEIQALERNIDGGIEFLDCCSGPEEYSQTVDQLDKEQNELDQLLSVVGLKQPVDNFLVMGSHCVCSRERHNNRDGWR